MDIDLMVAEADPARHADLPGPDSPGADRLYREITVPGPRGRWVGGPGPGRGQLRRPGPGGRWLRRPGPGGRWLRRPGPGGSRLRRPALAVTAGLVAAGAAAALVITGLPAGPGGAGPDGGGPARGASGLRPVTAILDAAAVAAGHGAGASRPPGPGQYLYVQEIDVKGLSGTPTLACPEAPMKVRAWVAADGSGRQVGVFPARCARFDFEQTYARGGLPWWLYGVVRAGTLPTRPKALERAIVTRFEGGHSRPSATFVYAATFLNAGSTAALRAALYRVIESLPGVQNLGPATDRLGRHGQAVGLVTSGTREVLIFDLASTVVLEREMVAVPPRQPGNNMLPAGTVLQYTEYLRAGVVNSDTTIPPAPARPRGPGARTAPPPSGPAGPTPSSGAVTPSASSSAGTALPQDPAPTATPPPAGTS